MHVALGIASAHEMRYGINFLASQVGVIKKCAKCPEGSLSESGHKKRAVRAKTYALTAQFVLRCWRCLVSSFDAISSAIPTACIETYKLFTPDPSIPSDSYNSHADTTSSPSNVP